MDIFVSWSGPRSRAVAEALKEYLPMIVNAFNPWLSSADIDKGSRWSSELAAALATAKAGIICLTPNNLSAPYILFEAGALSKTVDKPFVCTLLIGMEPSDVSGPLALFQATRPTKDDLLQLLKTLNRALGESSLKDAQLHATFDLCWPKLKERLDNLPNDGPSGRPHRSERELLEELVDTVRSTGAQDNALLKRAVEGISDLSARIANIEAPSLSPFYSAFAGDAKAGLGYNRLANLSSLLAPGNTAVPVGAAQDRTAEDRASQASSGKSPRTRRIYGRGLRRRLNSNADKIVKPPIDKPDQS